MTPVVLAASRTSHLTLDQLPPLADVDHMKNLERRSFAVRFGTYNSSYACLYGE